MTAPKKNPFYNQRAWRRASRLARMRSGFMCVRCGAPIFDNYNTHHVKPVRSHPDLAFDSANHRALCLRCHRQVEAQELNKQQGCDRKGIPTGRDHPWNKPTGARLS